MKRVTSVFLALALATQVGFILCKATDPNYIQLFLLTIVLMLLALPIWGLTVSISRWKKHRWRALTPLAVGILNLLFLVPSFWLGTELGDWNFRRNQDEYERVIRIAEKLDIKGTIEVPLSPDSKLDTRFIKASKLSNGGLIVEFITLVGFPVKHSGYLYYSGKEVRFGSSLGWPHTRKILDHWYRVSD
jgi:hypothetical protein